MILAETLHLINCNPGTTEDKIVEIAATEKSYAGLEYNLTKRTLQRMKRKLRQLSKEQQHELLILYYDYSTKYRLFQYENSDPDVSY